MVDQNILKSMQEEISTDEYEKYIKQLEYDKKSSDSENVYFIAPNALIANFIKTKYKEKIQNLYQIKTGNIPNIIFTTKVNKINHNVNKNFYKEEIKKNEMSLYPTYTFDNFVVGSSNQYAYSIAKSISKNPGTKYNPVFIYGPTGLGKTHLIQAIGNELLKDKKRIIYRTSEQFLIDFSTSIQNSSTDKFRQKYRNCDLLLIDDVQFFSNKIQTQEEFFNTFNELHLKQAQIVLTSDKPPKMINGLEERLKSRFSWGLIADITSPELETKIAIINKKCEINGIELSKDVIEYIATNMDDGIREIESAISNLNALTKLLGQEITIEIAKNALKQQIKEKKENVSIEEIIEVIAKDLNIKPSDIKSKKRHKNIVQARRIGIYLSRTLTSNSMPSIASFFGMKDHTAVSHNIKKINEIMQNDEFFKLKTQELKNKILSKNHE